HRPGLVEDVQVVLCPQALRRQDLHRDLAAERHLLVEVDLGESPLAVLEIADVAVVRLKVRRSGPAPGCTSKRHQISSPRCTTVPASIDRLPPAGTCSMPPPGGCTKVPLVEFRSTTTAQVPSIRTAACWRETLASPPATWIR